VRQRVYSVLETHHLTATSWATLGSINSAQEGIRLSSVAEAVGMTPAMITLMANELIGQGLIKRIPHHTDGRAKLLVITPKGKQLANTVEQQLNQVIQDLLSGLTAGEIVSFQKTLETIIHNAQS